MIIIFLIIDSGANKHQQQNPFNKFFSESMKSMNFMYSPMTRDEAVKILNLDPKDINPNSILDVTNLKINLEIVIAVHYRIKHIYISISPFIYRIN